MLTPEELESIPIELQQQFRGLESRVMSDVVRRLQNAGEMTNSAEQQLAALYSTGYSAKDIENLIGDILSISAVELNQIMDSVISRYNSQQERFDGGIQYKDNKELQQLVSAVKTQTNSDFKNITQSMGFAAVENGNTKFLPIADFYQKTLDGAMLDLASGSFDYNTVLNRVITQMTNSGLRTVAYASGHSDRVEVAVRRAVMTGLNQVTAKITEQNMDLLDTEYVEVSYHGGARPSHQVWQGKVYHWNRGGKAEKSDENTEKNPLTNKGESGIIKTSKKMSAPLQKPPDFSKYPVTEDLQAVKNVRQSFIDYGLDKSNVNLSDIQNAEVLEPFLKRLNKIKSDTGFIIPNINAVDVIDGDSCCIASYKPFENKFYISSKFFNSKDALTDTLKQWANNGILPKQAKSIAFLTEHETAHMRIPDKILKDDKALTIHKQFCKSKFANENDENIAEFFADSMATYRLSPNNTPQKMMEVIEFLKEEGVI